ncbi:Palmitoyl-protein_thioesterase [Hexamita inflata]|uniref:Palmitoyl-protein_thioesterase n=1 Tax=Hexamita inflata TaxID=28002 RepID=A0ABP1I8T0_9EUKA
MLMIIVIAQKVPIVLLHGFSQTVKDIEPMAEILRQALPDTYIKCCEIGNGDDSTVIMTVKSQIHELSKCIQNDPQLANGFVGLGYSNGGYIMRGYLELYNDKKVPMKRLVTLSSPLGGFFCGKHSPCYTFGELPFFAYLCTELEYTTFVQDVIGPSNYWRDPYNIEKYLEGALSLPELDNLRNFQEQKRRNFMSVDKIVLFGSPKDGAISPWQSAWFGTWEGDDRTVINMEDRDVYKTDLFGLKTMHQQGKLIKIDSNLSHLEYYSDKKFLTEDLPQWIDIDV